MIPKRGFNNKRFAKVYAEVNVEDLNIFEDGSVVSAKELIEAGLIKKEHDGLCVLGTGELEKKLTVRAAKYSKTAAEKIESIGGKAEVI